MEEKIKQTSPTLHRYLFRVTTFSKLLAMFLFILFPFVGFYAGMKYQQQVIIDKSINTTIPVTKPLNLITPPLTQLTQNGITIINPKNNSTVGRTFVLRGTAPLSQIGESPEISIDSDNNRYWPTAARNQQPPFSSPVDKDGNFLIEIDLNGNRAVQFVPNVTSKSASVQYFGLSPGIHTFHIFFAGSQSAPKIDGPTLILNVQ